MPIYNVNIRETIDRTIEVEAEDIYRAEDIGEAQFWNSRPTYSESDVSYREIQACRTHNGVCEETEWRELT